MKKNKPKTTMEILVEDLTRGNLRLREALARMYIWQRNVQELLPDELNSEVEGLLGRAMIDAIKDSPPDTSYADIIAVVHARAKFKINPVAREGQ